MGARVPQLFVSYRKKDRELALALKQRLEQEGYTIWWDNDIPPGVDFGPVLNERLRSSDAIVTIWTKNSVQSKWVFFESMMACEMEKSVPLQFENCEIPYGLHRNNKYRYNPDWPRSNDSWQFILRQIEVAIERGKRSGKAVASLDEVIWDRIKDSRELRDMEDFLERYESSEHAGEARSALALLKRKTWKVRAAWWAFGLLFFAALAAPFVSLHLVYDQQDAWFYASLYFPFFAFFATFGLMMVPIYCFTLAKALRYGLSEGIGFRPRSLASRAAALALLVVAPIVTCLTIASLEIRDGYAPWQFAPEVLAAPISSLARDVAGLQDLQGRPDIYGDDRTVAQLFQTTRYFDLQSLLQWRNSNIDDLPCVASPQSTIQPLRLASDRDCVTHMNNLQLAMEHAHRDPANLSLTAYAYRYCFFFFALAFMGTYFNIYVLTLRSERVRVWMARLSPWSGQRYSQILYLFAVQLFFIAVWFVSRMLFQLETLTILPSSGRGQFSQVIRNSYFLFFATYLIAIGFVVMAAFRFRNSTARVGIVAMSVVTAVIVALAFSVTWFCRALQQFIGVHATTASLVVLLIVMFFVVFVPLVLPNMLPAKEEELAS